MTRFARTCLAGAVALLVSTIAYPAVAAYDEQQSRLRTDYAAIQSILWDSFKVDSTGEPQNGEYTGNVDTDAYYGTEFTYQAGDGRRHELVRYQPKDGGELVWGWTYEYLRDGDDFHEVSRRLTRDAAYPPSDTDFEVAQEVEHGSYGGRIWCTWGRDMVMVTGDMIVATAGLYGHQQIGESGKVFVELARTGVDKIMDVVYEGPPAEGDYCTEESTAP